MKSRILLTIALASSLSQPPAFASSIATTKHIQIWHSYTGSERSALDEVLKQFNLKNASLQVESSFVPFNALAEKLTAAIPRGHGPDVFIFAHDRIGGWAEAKLVEPIEMRVNEAMLDQHITPCVFALAYGNSLYGLPLAFKALALFVRTDLVSNIPQNAKAFMDTAKALTVKEKGRYGFVYPAGDFFFHTPLFYSMGGQIFSGKETTPKLNRPGVVRSLAAAQKFHRMKLLPDDPSPVVSESMFLDGRAAMIINGPWFLSRVQGKVPFAVTPIPPFFDGIAASGFSSCEGIFMNRNSQNKKAAFTLMDFLSNDLWAASIRMKKGQQTVTLNRSWDQELPKFDPAGREIFSSFKTAFSRAQTSPSFPSMNAVWGPMNAALYNVMHKDMTPAAAADDAQARIEKALGQ